MKVFEKIKTNSKVIFEKNGPTILLVAGIGLGVGAVISAAKASTKASDIFEEQKEKLEEVKQVQIMAEEGNLPEGREYTEQDYKKDLSIVYTQSIVKVAKLYLPTVLFGAASIACLVGSHRILKRQNAALGSALAATTAGFATYRNRVVQKFGEEVDKELRYGTRTEKVTEIVTDEDGKESKVTRDISVRDGELSEYQFLYDNTMPHWQNVGDYNRMFLKSVQTNWNLKLQAYGHVFLNDVLKDLGYEPTLEGQIVGWVYDPENPEIDNFIDFGVLDTWEEDELEAKRENNKAGKPNLGNFTRFYTLDFNVDGPIINFLPSRKNRKL